MKKILGSKQRRPKDAGRLLDEALDDKCQRRKYWKCERERNLLFIGNKASHRKRHDQPKENTWRFS